MAIETDDRSSKIFQALGLSLSVRDKATASADGLRPAAVLILLYDKSGEPHVLLNKRSQHVEHHKGEISFPGGGRDPEDAGFLATAIRETHEEMGIEPKDVTIIGELDDVVTRSDFCVRVYVGTIPYPYPFKPYAREVAEVLEAPMSSLLDRANWREEARLEDGAVHRSYSYAYKEHLVYGATAMMVRQLIDIYSSLETVRRGS